MQHGQPRFEDIATLALLWLRPRTTNTSTFGVCELKNIFRRTDILTPLWIRLRHGQQMAQYQQATRTCQTARDSTFWKLANTELWQKDRRAWKILFPEQGCLPTRRPPSSGQPFQLPFSQPWLDRPFPPRALALMGAFNPESKRRRCILAEAFRTHTLFERAESRPDTTTPS